MLLKEYSIKDMEAKLKSIREIRIKERLRIVLFLREGYSQRDVSKMLRLSVGIVPYWKKRFEEGGFDGLKDKAGRGIKAKLDEEQLSMLASSIDSGLLMNDNYPRGFKTKDIVEFIRNNFFFIYTTRHCRRILDSIGCSLQVPRPRNKRRKQEDVNQFKQEFKKNEKVWMMTQLS